MECPFSYPMHSVCAQTPYISHMTPPLSSEYFSEQKRHSDIFISGLNFGIRNADGRIISHTGYTLVLSIRRLFIPLLWSAQHFSLRLLFSTLDASTDLFFAARYVFRDILHGDEVKTTIEPPLFPLCLAFFPFRNRRDFPGCSSTSVDDDSTSKRV